MTHLGWMLIAFRNALWQLRRASSLEEGVVDTVMSGGDTDTNAAIAGALLGALLGAVHGRDAVPSQWVECILACRPEDGRPASASLALDATGPWMCARSRRTAGLPGELRLTVTGFSFAGRVPFRSCPLDAR